MKDIRVRYIGLGKIENGRLLDLEKQVGELLADGEIVVGMYPYMLMMPGKSIVGKDMHLLQLPPTPINGVLIVTDKKENT